MGWELTELGEEAADMAKLLDDRDVVLEEGMFGRGGRNAIEGSPVDGNNGDTLLSQHLGSRFGEEWRRSGMDAAMEDKRFAGQIEVFREGIVIDGGKVGEICLEREVIAEVYQHADGDERRERNCGEVL